MTFAIAILATTIAAAASPTAIDVARIPGAWASGEKVEACATAPISMFFSDGSVAVFVSAGGALHAVGAWRFEGGQMRMTHNDAPFAMDGAAKPESILKIVELSAGRFVTSNAEGKQRVRVRCSGLERRAKKWNPVFRAKARNQRIYSGGTDAT